MPSGGYRKPTNPAPVSGPGAMSRRTDTQPKMSLPDAQYGEQAAMQSIQGSAPMLGGQQAGAGSPGPATIPQGMSPLPVVPFGAPTQNPNEPVTAGAALGPGPGPASMGVTPDPQMQVDRQDAQRLVAYLPVLESMANRPGASMAMKTYVRQIKTLVASQGMTQH